MTRRIPALAVAVLMLGPLAACGGGDDSDSAGDSATSESPSSPTSATPESTGPESPAPPEESTGSEADLTASEQAYCDEVAGAREELSGSGAGGIGAGAAVEALEDIARLAPTDVRPAWQSLSSTAATVQEVVRKAGLKLEDLEDPQSLGSLTGKQERILTEGLTGVDIAGLQQDSAVISEQVGQLCGLQLSPGASPE
jgi:hypothetical protein